jgi:hypothetical protein
VSSTSKLDTGNFNVKFSKDITNCSWLASLGAPSTSSGGNGMISTQVASSTNDTIQVTTLNTSGAAADRAFHLHVFC